MNREWKWYFEYKRGNANTGIQPEDYASLSSWKSQQTNPFKFDENVLSKDNAPKLMTP